MGLAKINTAEALHVARRIRRAAGIQHPLTQASLQGLWIGDLAPVGEQRRELPLEETGHVHQRVGILRARDIDLSEFMRQQAFLPFKFGKEQP